MPVRQWSHFAPDGELPHDTSVYTIQANIRTFLLVTIHVF